jgi:hypothetical protein
MEMPRPKEGNAYDADDKTTIVEYFDKACERSMNLRRAMSFPH